MNVNYEEIDFMCGSTIESCVNELLKYKERGRLVLGSFNGHVLYSDSVTMDNAYKEITGKTKKEFDDFIKKQKDDYEHEEKEHKAKIPELAKVWMGKGREILEESKWEHWDMIVPIRLNDLYRGMELGQCLEVIKLINDGGTFAEAKELMYSQGHSGMSFGLMCNMLTELCPNGEALVSFVRN